MLYDPGCLLMSPSGKLLFLLPPMRTVMTAAIAAAPAAKTAASPRSSQRLGSLREQPPPPPWWPYPLCSSWYPSDLWRSCPSSVVDFSYEIIGLDSSAQSQYKIRTDKSVNPTLRRLQSIFGHPISWKWVSCIYKL